MKIKIKKLNPNAKLPTKAHKSDFCYDVYATSCKRVGWRTWEYGIGLSFEIVRNQDSLYCGLTHPTLEELVSRYDSFTGIDSEGNPQTYGENVKLSLDFRPRSSVYRTGMILSNCEGTLDELYRGEIKAVFYRVNIFGKKYKVGDRIGQIKLGFTLPLEFEEVEELDMNTDRGTGGFGSTGRN